MAVIARGGGGSKKKVKNPFKKAVQGPATYYGNVARNIFAGRPMVAPAQPSNPYAGMVNDYLNQARADFGADSAADAASRDAALRRFIISYGEVPDFAAMGGLGKDALGFLKGAITPEIAALAAKNTAEGTSIKARMAHDNMVANRRIPATLAGRGMLRSGQTGADLSEQGRQFKILSFDTLNELLGGIEGTVGNFLSNERQRQRELAQAAMDAAAQSYGDWGDSYMDSGGGSTGDYISSLKPTGSRTTTTRKPGPSKKFLKKLGRKYQPPKRQRISGRQY